MAGWIWWDWSLILGTYSPAVLWHCWLGHMTCKSTRLHPALSCATTCCCIWSWHKHVDIVEILFVVLFFCILAVVIQTKITCLEYIAFITFFTGLEETLKDVEDRAKTKHIEVFSLRNYMVFWIESVLETMWYLILNLV